MKNFQNLGVEDFVGILRRRIWYIILTTVVVSAASIYYVSRLPSVYRSDTFILVTNRIVPEDYIASIVRDTVADRMNFVTQRLHSRTFVEQIVREFHLGGPTSQSIEGAVAGVIGSTEIIANSVNSLRISFTSTNPQQAQAIVHRL